MFDRNNAIFCLPVEEIDGQFRTEFITGGYRKPGISFTDCLRSIFVPYCNESFNVWSHLLFGLYFAIKYWQVFTEEVDITDPFVWPLLIVAMSTVFMCLISATAHTFNSMSPYAHDKCFYLDYAGIGIYGLGFNQAYYSYSRPLDLQTMLFHSPALFLTIASIISVFGTYLLCKSLSAKWSGIRHTIKPTMTALSYIFASTTIFYRYIFCTSKVDCDNQSFSLYWKHTIFMVIAVVTYAIKIPERFCEGMFNCFGSSHNIMHVFVGIGMYFKFEFIKSEIMRRKYRLVNDEVQSIAYTSLSLMVSSFVFILTICYLVEPDEASKCNGEKKKE